MDGSTELPICDNEPIHIPGSIQPHGILLVATRDRLAVTQAAGPIESRLGMADWHGAPLGALIGADLAEQVRALAAREIDPAHALYLGRMKDATGVPMDVSAHLAAMTGAAPGEKPLVVVELEPASLQTEAPPLLDELEKTASGFQRARNLDALFAEAARGFRRLIGYDRVLIYRFNDDEAGRVVAEDLEPPDGSAALHSFMNHHFPASDIPRQARVLYVRNRSRVIPDIHYTPAPVRPGMPGSPLDMSDCSLRSVSPVHLQYMFNMGMRASASFSLVRDGVLWGLVACHNRTPKTIPYDLRAGGRMLAGVLAREIYAKEEADFYRQRLRLRSFEDDVVRVLSQDASLDAALARHISDVQRALDADGVAVLRGHEIATGGICPPAAALTELVRWLAHGAESVRATDRLPELYPPAHGFADVGSGMLSLLLSADEPWAVLWFRGEQVEKIRWAGNPHTANDRAAGDLTPRASFQEWVETVRGRSRRWSLAETEAAGRLRQALLDVRQSRRMQELNRQLTGLLHDKTLLVQQKEFLIGEVNHRVQNSLQLVSSFLAMQARNSTDPSLRASLDEARRRLAAVSLVHQRLYRGQQVEVIDGARYVEELCADTVEAMGEEWKSQLSLDLTPISISTERAVPMGLVLTELIINANKYAYGGLPGPLEIRLVQDRTRFQLSVSDQGVGFSRESSGTGFGSRLMRALVQQIGGELNFENNRPGLRAVLTADSEPLQETGRPMATANARLGIASGDAQSLEFHTTAGD
jgi:light-regulated signal transduction histidine kinase (bacteriophytochrome)